MDKVKNFLSLWRERYNDYNGEGSVYVQELSDLVRQTEEEHDNADKLIMDIAHEVAQENKKELADLKTQIQEALDRLKRARQMPYSNYGIDKCDYEYGMKVLRKAVEQNEYRDTKGAQ